MPKRVLIVDDEKDLLFSMKGLIEAGGAEVDTAGTVEEAISLLGGREYRAAIVDVRLGGRHSLDGFRLLEYMKEHGVAVDTIMMTGYGNPESMERAYVLGAAFYFEKPVLLGSLLNALESLGVGCGAVGCQRA